MSSVKLQPELVSLIKRKSVECGDTALKMATTFISQLLEHVEGKKHLSNFEIENKLDYLVGCLTITVDLPMVEMEFLRVRKCEKGMFNNLSELSYIANVTNDFPPKGRLNAQGVGLFYASVAVQKNDKALMVVLSEARANTLDRVNVLRSVQKAEQYLNLRFIGIWDYVRRRQKPYYLADNQFEYYRQASKLMNERFSTKQLEAYFLTDRFFADMLTRQSSDSLYDITSVIGKFIMEGDSTDGILYSSVQAIGEPVVALKPLAVDKKLEHQLVTDVIVNNHHVYEFYDVQTVKVGQFDNLTGNITWN